MFGAQVGPDDAELNICKWVRLISPDASQHCLAGVTSTQILAFGTILFSAGIIWFVWDFIARRRPKVAQRAGPNWPIRDLFFHIDPSILKNCYRSPEKEVAADVLDRLATGQMHSWGRFTGSNGALISIPQDFWKDAEWVMMFFGPDDADLVHARYRETNTGYRDVQFNRDEALAIWPRSIKTVWPDFSKWDKVDPLEIYQAACLWADIEPQFPLWPSWGAEKVFYKLNEHALKHELLVTTDKNVRDSVKEAIQTVTTRKVDPHGKVSRDDLIEIAEKWAEKPKFLYPRSRV